MKTLCSFLSILSSFFFCFTAFGNDYHYIAKGENVTKISKIYGTTVSELAEKNNLVPPYKIIAGRYLKVKDSFNQFQSEVDALTDKVKRLNLQLSLEELAKNEISEQFTNLVLVNQATEKRYSELKKELDEKTQAMIIVLICSSFSLICFIVISLCFVNKFREILSLILKEIQSLFNVINEAVTDATMEVDSEVLPETKQISGETEESSEKKEISEQRLALFPVIRTVTSLELDIDRKQFLVSINDIKLYYSLPMSGDFYLLPIPQENGDRTKTIIDSLNEIMEIAMIEIALKRFISRFLREEKGDFSLLLDDIRNNRVCRYIE